MNNKRTILIAFFLIILNAIYAQSGLSITIPAIHIPAKHIPALHIPAVHIPEIKTSYGTIASIDIPAIEIPSMEISAVDTASESIALPDYAKINRSSIISYASLKPEKKQRLPLPQAKQLIKEERDNAFRKYAPYSTKEMVDFFASADLDNSGSLSWDELTVFQVHLYHTYEYKSLDKAIRPDEFMVGGGGDCKDWSLFTTAFCKYWGWDSYIGCFFKGDVGHAICFVKAQDELPEDYVCWNLRGQRTVEGFIMPTGTYVPVDYDHVGSYSNALKAGMKLDYFLTPEEMYHRFG